MNRITFILAAVLCLAGVATGSFAGSLGGSLQVLYGLAFFAIAIFLGLSMQTVEPWQKLVVLRIGKL
jgi:hypothetical protein